MMHKILKNLLIGHLLLLISLPTIGQILPLNQTKDWNLVWNDEFDYDNADLGKKWESQNEASPSEWVLCSRWRENAVVHDGILELLAKKESRGGQDWTCASIWTNEKFGYGYFECRYKYAGATGTNNSFWMYPRGGVPTGEKAFELDVNEGHFPNEVNSNVHNWTDKLDDGSHPNNQIHQTFGGNTPLPGYTHIFKTPIKSNKIRFSSNHGSHFHIGEFRIYAPNEAGYPTIEVSETADNDVDGLVNFSRDASSIFRVSGQYVVNDGRSTDAKNVGDGEVATTGKSWISQAAGEKWLEIELENEKEIGAIQFTNGWKSGSTWNGLISHYKLQYFDGSNWIEIVEYNVTGGADFSKEYHTYGLEWNESELKFYFDGDLFRTEKHTECHSKTNVYLSLAILSNNIAGAVTDAIDGTSMKVDYVRYFQLKEEQGVGFNSEKTNSEILVYPNPAQNFVNVENVKVGSQVKLNNVMGQNVYSAIATKTNFQIDVNNLKSDINFLRIGNEVKKIIVR